LKKSKAIFQAGEVCKCVKHTVVAYEIQIVAIVAVKTAGHSAYALYHFSSDLNKKEIEAAILTVF